MKIYTDYHIHSHYSIATSKFLIPEMIEIYAIIKGLKIVATGDILHPIYNKELRTKLKDCGNGLFKLRKEFSFLYNNNFLEFIQKNKLDIKKFKNLYFLIKSLIKRKKDFDSSIYFILNGEISSIYKKNNKVRKNHNLIFFPDFESVEKMQKEIEKLGGNLKSDGRPIVGIDSEILLKLTYDTNEKNLFVPAHIWTPWFSMLGSKSGFNSIGEAFNEYKSKIYAIETGLSSDPQMNFLCSFLDEVILLSNSDAHSPEKLGRNANIYELDKNQISYNGLIEPIKTKNLKIFKGTLDTFPQLGKYYFDGHRKCNFRISPVESKEKYNDICPVCKKKVTKGVLSRVLELADRSNPEEKKIQQKFYHFVTLKEIIAKTIKKGENTKTVDDIYTLFIFLFGPELKILIDYDFKPILEDIGRLDNIFFKNKDLFNFEKDQFSSENDLFNFTKDLFNIEKDFLNFNKNLMNFKNNTILNKSLILQIIKNILKIRNKEITLVEGFDGKFGEILF